MYMALFMSLKNGLKLFVFVGARCVATLLHEMKKRGRDCRFGVISMCIGTLSFLTVCLHLCMNMLQKNDGLSGVSRYWNGSSCCF